MKLILALLLFSSLAHAQLISSPTQAQAVQGKAFVATTGPMTLALAGNMRALFTNPAGSNVTVLINRIATVNTTVATVFANMYLNPTNGLPIAVGYASNVILGGPASKAYFTNDTSVATPLSGGTLIMPFVVPPGRTEFDTSFVVNPGSSVGFNSAFAGAAIGEIVFYYTEI